MFRRASPLLILTSICENSSCFWFMKISCQVFIIKYQCNKSALEADSTLLAFTVAVSVGSADFQKSHDKGNNGTGKRLKTLNLGLLRAPGQVDTVLAWSWCSRKASLGVMLAWSWCSRKASLGVISSLALSDSDLLEVGEVITIRLVTEPSEDCLLTFHQCLGLRLQP